MLDRYELRLKPLPLPLLKAQAYREADSDPPAVSTTLPENGRCWQLYHHFREERQYRSYRRNPDEHSYRSHRSHQRRPRTHLDRDGHWPCAALVLPPPPSSWPLPQHQARNLVHEWEETYTKPQLLPPQLCCCYEGENLLKS